ncbi:MAG: class I SAM-dependent methyltransferase [Candidatus Marinimicrobia bacterium]|nr:class I SAM-dependent methyltransferase [Candidatus Neomarinimicrobiota bacterium]
MANRTEQKEVFLKSEADQWFDRNKESYKIRKAEGNISLQFLKSIKLSPNKILEIGCSNGNRLVLLKDTFNSDCWGIDPSSKAISEGKKMYPEISLHVGTADSLPFESDSFDTIIFGFCLYLCDRNDLFKIAYEVDRCLKNEGTLIIEDFSPPFPYKNKYSHLDGIYSYKMDYSKMFNWNPNYSEIANIAYSHSGFQERDIPNEKVSTIVLRKNSKYAYPDEPFSS